MPRGVPRVAGALELTDVLRHVLVLGRCGVDRGFPGRGLGAQRLAIDVHTGELLEAVQQRQRHLRRRGRRGDVVGHARPQTRCGDARVLGEVLEDGEDADRTLVQRALEAVRLAHLLVLARGEDRYRSGVRDIGQHRPESHETGDVVAESDVDELGGEGLPGARRFGAREQPELGPGRRIARTPQSGLRPRQLAAALGIHPRRGTRVLVVEVQLRVDGVHEVVLRR